MATPHISVERGDITTIDIHAIVNAANCLVVRGLRPRTHPTPGSALRGTPARAATLRAATRAPFARRRGEIVTTKSSGDSASSRGVPAFDAFAKLAAEEGLEVVE